MPRYKPCHFNVRPRFTPGSPGLVNEAIATHVAEQERDAQARAATGVYGPEIQARAQDEHALSGIAYLLEEHAKFWRVYDLITEEKRDVPFGQWRLETLLIGKGHAPSEARKVAEEVYKLSPKIDPGWAFERFETTLALYEGSEHPFPRERALNDSIREASKRG